MKYVITIVVIGLVAGCIFYMKHYCVGMYHNVSGEMRIYRADGSEVSDTIQSCEFIFTDSN